MRTLAVAAVLLVMIVSGAWAAAWLNSGEQKASPIGDIGLPAESAPRRTAEALPPPGYFWRGSVLSSTPTPTVELGTEPELIIAGTPSPLAIDAPALRRDDAGPVWRDDFRRSAGVRGGGGSSGVGFAATGIGSPGGGGSPGARAASSGVSATHNASSMTAIRQETTRERPARTPPARSSSSSSRSSGTTSGGDSSGGSTVAATPTTTLALAPTVTDPLAPVGTVGGGTVGLVPSGFEGAPSPSPTPEPATMLLLGTGLVGLYRMRRHIG